VLIVVLGGSLAVVGYPAAGAPRRPLAGGTRPDQARPATAASVGDPPGTGASSARSHSARPSQSASDPTPASQDPQTPEPQTPDPQPSAAPSGSGGQPTAGTPTPRSQPPSARPSSGRGGGQPGTARAVTPHPSEANPPPDGGPVLRPRPRAPTLQSIEPEAIQSDAGVLPEPTPATPPAGPSGEAAALPIDNPTSGGPAAMDQPLTLIGSGLFALLIAVTGMTMVGRRRRHW
jgi:hypothetical protein